MADTTQLARRSFSALAWSGAGAVARALLQFAVQVALARLLGPESFGLAAAALLVVGLGALLAEGGLGSALIQRGDLQPRDVGLALGWVLLLSAVVAGLVALAAAPLAAALGQPQLVPYLWAAAAVIPLQALSTLPLSLLQRALDIRRLQALQFVAYALAYGGAGIGAAWLGAGAWSILIAFGSHALIVAVAGSAMLRPPQRHTLRPGLTGGAELLAYGGRITAANLLNWAVESIDRALVSRGWGAQRLGEYALAANLSRAPVMVLVGAAQSVAFVSAARLQEEPARIARGYVAVVALALALAAPIFVFLAWHAGFVVGLLYGPPWAGAAPVFAWLALGVPPFVMLALTGPMLRGLAAVGAEMRAQAGALLVLAAALGWLLLREGAALSEAAAVVAGVNLLRAAWMYRALAQRIGLAPGAWLAALRGGAVLASVVVVACWAWQPAPAAVAFAGSMLTAAAACAAVLRATRGHVLAAELLQALDNRRSDSQLARQICSLLDRGA